APGGAASRWGRRPPAARGPRLARRGGAGLPPAVSMSPPRQRLIAERTTASRSAEGRPPPSSRTPPHSICIDYIRARLLCNLLRPLVPVSGGRGDVLGAIPGDQAPYQAKEGPAGRANDGEHIGRGARMVHRGSRPAETRPGPTGGPSCC